MPNSLLIENGTVLTLGKASKVLAGYSVLIENGLVTKVAPKKAIKNFRGKRIDATGKVVLPGFINAHTHFYSSFARGLTKAKPSKNFNQVLKNLWWRLDSALITEDCYYSALIALLGSIRHGTTTLIDHHASPRAVVGSLGAIERAVRETGLRACLCYELSDRDGARIAKEGLAENAWFIHRCRQQNQARESYATSHEVNTPSPPSEGGEGRGEEGCHAQTYSRKSTRHLAPLPGPLPVRRGEGVDTARAACLSASGNRVQALFGLHASFTISDATMEKAAALGHELRTGFHIHVAEAQSDQDWALKHCGKRVVERLKKFEILGPRSIAAHCIHVNRREMDLLAETRTAVVHNPQSNMNNAVGVANVIELAKRGVLVGLGTDAMTTNMLEELRVALWGQHLRAENPSVGFGEVTSALFTNNPKIAGRIFGLRFGELCEGAAGDIAIFDYDPPTPLESGNVFGHLVFGISQTEADTTIVGGRVLMENRKLALNLDEARVNARARELAKDLWERM